MPIARIRKFATNWHAYVIKLLRLYLSVSCVFPSKDEGASTPATPPCRVRREITVCPDLIAGRNRGEISLRNIRRYIASIAIARFNLSNGDVIGEGTKLDGGLRKM